MAQQKCSDWSFELVDFGSREAFRRVIRENNLKHRMKLFLDSGTDLEGTPRETTLFLWTEKHGRVTMVTKDNPFTGQASVKGTNDKRNEEITNLRKTGKRVGNPFIGQADKIGISGNFERVNDLAKSIRKYAGKFRENKCERDDLF